MNRQQFPNGGWAFHQPQTNWFAPAPIGNTFDQQVVNIIKHRLSNPAVVARYGLSTNPLDVGNELERFTRLRLGLPDDPLPKQVPPPPVKSMLSEAAAGAVGVVRKLASGNAILLEWEQSGLPPVAPEISASNAAVCVTCPKNSKEEFTRFFTMPIADRLRKHFARLHEMNLTTPSDDKLFVCSACLCPLRLKVHCDKNLILKHLKPEQRSELDPVCWITK